METIESRVKHLWNIVDSEYRIIHGGKRKQRRTYFKVECSLCGFKKTDTKSNIERIVACPGCEKKPAAIREDNQENCISLCEIGTVEFIRDFQSKHKVSERQAVRQFIETVKAHLPPGDPVAGNLTEGSTRARVRRLTGKKPDSSKKTNRLEKVCDSTMLPGADRSKVDNCVDPVIVTPVLKNDLPISAGTYSTTVEELQACLDRHFPGHGHLVIKAPLPCIGCGHDRFDAGFFCRLCGSRQSAAINLKERNGKQ